METGTVVSRNSTHVPGKKKKEKEMTVLNSRRGMYKHNFCKARELEFYLFL